MSATGGSYPSGHMIALVVCLGGCLLVWEADTRWFLWLLIAVPAAGMALALLYGAAHWLSRSPHRDASAERRDDSRSGWV